MKLIPKHAVCPYCRTVYRFAELRKLSGKKEDTCYHCKKTVDVSRGSVWFLALETLAVYAILNAVAIGLLQTVQLVPLLIMNTVPAIAAMLLIPLYTELKKSPKNKKSNKKGRN